jgi:hypothetical protein
MIFLRAGAASSSNLSELFCVTYGSVTEAQCSSDMKGGMFASMGHEVLVVIVSAGGCRG